MEELNEILKNDYEKWIDLRNNLQALSSTVKIIHSSMMTEQISEHILATYITINDAIMGIIQYTDENITSLAHEALEEDDKEQFIPFV